MMKSQFGHFAKNSQNLALANTSAAPKFRSSSIFFCQVVSVLVYRHRSMWSKMTCVNQPTLRNRGAAVDDLAKHCQRSDSQRTLCEER